jgi:hypothetical protein
MRHVGGLLRFAHSGLALDEGMFVGKQGEGVLSERGMNALARASLANLNSGGGGQPSTLNVTIVAADASSFSTLLENDRPHFDKMMVDGIAENPSVRRAFRESM